MRFSHQTITSRRKWVLMLQLYPAEEVENPHALLTAYQKSESNELVRVNRRNKFFLNFYWKHGPNLNVKFHIDILTYLLFSHAEISWILQQSAPTEIWIINNNHYSQSRAKIKVPAGCEYSVRPHGVSRAQICRRVVGQSRDTSDLKASPSNKSQDSPEGPRQLIDVGKMGWRWRYAWCSPTLLHVLRPQRASPAGCCVIMSQQRPLILITGEAVASCVFCL